MADSDGDEVLIEKIRNMAVDLIDTGTHQDLAKTASFIAKTLGLNDRLINYTHIELRNKLNEFKFRKVPFKKRIIFLPQCLRNSKVCKAELTEEGWQCKECGGCIIPKINSMAKEIGYKKLFIVPGGSMVFNLINKYKPEAVVGVACFPELNLAVSRLKGEGHLAAQAVMLLKDGCKDTAVNFDEVKEKLDLIETPKKKTKTEQIKTTKN